jgi:hypothetical protein
MNRKWIALAASMLAVSILAAGATLAQDEKEKEGPLAKKMDQVNKKNLAIRKAFRTTVSFKKANNGKDISKDANDLVKLAKEARGMKDAVDKAKDVKDPQTKWNELMDAFIKVTEDFSKNASVSGATQDAVKKEYISKVAKACTDCHNVFRVDEEEFK